MMRIPFFMVFILGVVPLAFGETLQPQSYQLDQCAVIQTSQPPRVYLTNPSGEVEAVDVATGKQLWHTAKASFVFLARGNRLLAMSPAVVNGKPGCQPQILDARSGNVQKVLKWPETWPGECAGDGLGSSFYVQGFTQDGRDGLVWTYTWRPTPGGAYKGPDYVYPPGSSGQKQGLVVVDLFKGEVLPPSGNYPVSLRGQNNPWGGYSIEPFKVDGVTAQAVMESIEGRFRLLLRRWKDGEPLPEVRLGEPPWNSCGVEVTADHKYALGVYQVPNQSQIKLSHMEKWAEDHPELEPYTGKNETFYYHVEVYSAASGEKRGEINATSWPSMAQICGNLMVSYFPSRVFVMDITTGKEVWSRPLKDLTYRGPYPPAANRPPAPSGPKDPEDP